MPIARVQSVAAQQSAITTASYVLPSNVAAGSLIVLAEAWYFGNTTTPAVPTDTRGNTYVQVATSGWSTDAAVFIYAAYNSTAGACTVSHTAGSAGLYTGGAAIEYSGALTAAAFDVADGDIGTSTAPATGPTLTTAQADEMVIAIASLYDSVNPTGFASPPNTGFSSIANNQDGVSGLPYTIGDKIVAATGTQSADWGTLGASRSWFCAIATFKAIVAAVTGARLTMMGCGR